MLTASMDSLCDAWVLEGFVSFAAPSATGVIVGATGAYRGVRGTFTSIEAKDVLHLLP